MIEVVVAGAHTRVEDLGTRGRAHRGFSLGGAADMRALVLANRALGNGDDARAIEATFAGPTLRFTADTRVAWCGGAWDVTLDAAPVARLTPVDVRAGQTLKMGPCRSGLRAVLACAGGLEGPAGRVLASGAHIAGADVLEQARAMPAASDVLRELLEDAALHDPALDDPTVPWTLRVTDAPQTGWFSSDSLEAFASSLFQVTQDVSRRGVHVSGPALRRDDVREPISEGIAPGSIQVTHAGDPILLGVDQTTTGGYAKIGCVARVDLWKLGQLRPGSRVRFSRVTLDEARRALFAWNERLPSPS